MRTLQHIIRFMLSVAGATLLFIGCSGVDSPRVDQVAFPEEAPLALVGMTPYRIGQTALALSPDGTNLVYVAGRDGSAQLYTRNLVDGQSTPLIGTEGAYYPFFSPDGQQVGFFVGNRIKKVTLLGGTVTDLCTARNPYGAAWSADGRIYFGDQEGLRLSWVSENGGPVQDLEVGDGVWPQLLPDGKILLLSGWGQIVVLTPETGMRTSLVDLPGHNLGTPRYLTEGYLVFTDRGRLMAAPFDLGQQALTADPVSVLDDLRTEVLAGAAHFAVTNDGTLLYAPGGDVAVGQLRWVDQQGTETVLPFPPQVYGEYRLSPDGRRLAVAVFKEKWDIWIYDLEGGEAKLLTQEGNNYSPVWSPDGKQVMFQSSQDGIGNLYRTQADGTGSVVRVTTSEQMQWPSDWTPDGKAILIGENSPENLGDIWVLPLEGDRTPRLVYTSPYADWGGVLSPDGKLVAYMSDETGPYEVFVQSYPSGEGRVQASHIGGMDPIWSPDGRALFFHNVRQGQVVSVERTPTLKVGAPRMVFEGPYIDIGGKGWAVGSDRRFLLVKSVEEEETRTELRVVPNWVETLKQRISAGQ